MKKIFLSLVAVAAIAACTKSEVQYEPSSEIGFSPVAKLNTKAAVYNEEDPTDYPDELNMYVFANAGLDGADGNTTVDPAECSEPYFANAEFTHVSHDENVFGGVTPYYWPNVKSLIFSGFSKSGNVATIVESSDKPTYTFNNVKGVWEISIDGYKPDRGTDVLGNNDLMWFPTTVDSYSKPTTDDFTVDVLMKHACSWVTINIKGDATTGKNGTTWTILDATIADLAQKGDVVLGTEAEWDNLDDVDDFDVYEGDGKTLTDNFVDYTQLTYKDLVIIPQETKTLTVIYSFVSQAGGAADGSDIVIEEIKEIPLSYTSASTDNGWKQGVHYTYNITIGTKEILIEPTVEEWDSTEVIL